jgi:hypothetical protein
MNQSLLSLDSHFLFFDEAEKESFDIDSFLSPAYDMAFPVVDQEAVLSTPFSSPNKINDSGNGVCGDENFFNVDEEVKRPKKSEMNTYIKDLERRVTELLNENSKLKENVYSLSTDKERLENEILLMQQLMRSGMSQDNMECKEEFNIPTVMSSNNLLGLKPHPQASTRVLLLVLLLSFGLLFHQTITTDPLDMRTNNNRTVSDLTQITSPKLEKDKNLSSSSQSHKKVERQNSGVQQKAAKRVLRHEKTSSTTTRSVKRRKETVKQQQQQPIAPIPFSATTIQTTPNPPNPRSVIPEIIQWRPNTTYLICNNVSQMVPPPSVSNNNVNPNPARMVSLLIPPDALGTSQENALLEVTCQVLDVNFVPLRL